MIETLRKGSKGESVKELQRLLGVTPDGDFGPNTEANVKYYQKWHGLKDDGVVGEKTWDSLMGIQAYPIDKHITKKEGRSIKYLVIHYTAGSTSTKGASLKNREVFLKREASADFVVDDDTTLQVNPDPRKYYCWAVGDGNGKYGITNANSISIEICSNLRKNTSASKPNHEGWFLTDAALERATKLAKYLMKKYDITHDHVVRHYDASHKNCPGLIGWNDGAVYSENGVLTGGKNNSKKWLEWKEGLR